MRCRPYLLLATVVVGSVGGFANKKDKKTLPEIALKAQTVVVVVQDDAREPISDPNANLKAQKEVEQAIMKWGRLRLMPDVQTADLVIAVQKGTGKAADETIGGGSVDNVPVIGERTDNGEDNSIRVGARQGTPPATTQYPGAETRRPSEGAQVGGSDDRLAVYLGGVEYPLDASPIWTYMGKDALKAPDVKAVEEFRKAVAEAEKAAKPEAATGTGTGSEAEREWNVDAKQAVEFGGLATVC